MVIANHLQRSYGAFPQTTIREVTEALAGKVDAELLDQIMAVCPS